MVNSYSEAIQFLYQQLPVFQHIGPAAYKKDLTNTLRLCSILKNPQNNFKTVHVAGTNGKGSSSHMIASVLQASGYKTGLYTSPHLKEFTERIKINGQEMKKEFVPDFVNRMMRPMKEIKPSFFELTVAMAFQYFADEQVDFAVIETGLGGRLDSTNIITPEVSLITNIGFDHMDILGDTLEKIALEKAGIIKEGIPAVVSERQPEVQHIFIEKAKQTHSDLFFASDLIPIKKIDSEMVLAYAQQEKMTLTPDLTGSYQMKNIPGVIQVCQVLQAQGYALTRDSIINGINHAARNTGLKGRWQKLADKPLMYCDTGHNAEGIAQVIEQIRLTPHQQLHWVFGVVKDKSPDKVLAMLPKDAFYYFCQAKIQRAMDADALYDIAKQHGLNGIVIHDVNAAIQKAKSSCNDDDLIVIGGSTFVVADIENL